MQNQDPAITGVEPPNRNLPGGGSAFNRLRNLVLKPTNLSSDNPSKIFLGHLGPEPGYTKALLNPN